MKKVFLFSLILSALSFKAAGQYAAQLREGKACSMITQEQLKIYLGKLKTLVNLAQQDKDKYGSTGAYPATSIYFHLHAVTAYDSLQATINWLNTGSNNNPSITNYVEAMSIKARFRQLISQLMDANHWAELSAIYHNSSFASCGKEEALRLLTEAVIILNYAGRCYTEPYTDIPPPNCK
jgi:hypothetical protein